MAEVVSGAHVHAAAVAPRIAVDRRVVCAHRCIRHRQCLSHVFASTGLCPVQWSLRRAEQQGTSHHMLAATPSHVGLPLQSVRWHAQCSRADPSPSTRSPLIAKESQHSHSHPNTAPAIPHETHAPHRPFVRGCSQSIPRVASTIPISTSLPLPTAQMTSNSRCGARIDWSLLRGWNLVLFIIL